MNTLYWSVFICISCPVTKQNCKYYALSMFLQNILAFGKRVLETGVPERAFWRILFSNNLWFIKFFHHDTSARLPGWWGFWLTIQQSKHASTLRVYETLNPIWSVHFRGVFPMALGETFFSQWDRVWNHFFAKNQDWELLQAQMDRNGGWSHQEIVKNTFVM